MDGLGTEFLALHEGPEGFVMPNAWDAGSAILLAQAGFPAIATTSAGIAFSLGRPDYAVEDPRLTVSREAMIERAAEIARAVPVPVSADLEAGYGDAPEAVAETVALAIAAGLAGANIEDRRPGSAELYPAEMAAERIAAARSAIAAAGIPFVLTARTDRLLLERRSIADTVDRLQRYREAGADCLYAPGSSDPETARTLVARLAAPINFVVGLGPGGAAPRQLLDLGARRISLGGSLARAAMALVRRAAAELRDFGTIGYASEQDSQEELNALFTAAHRSGEM